MAIPSQRNLLLVLCTVFIVIAVASSQQCYTNENGEIIWGSLPSMRPPTSNLDYQTDEQRRGTLSDMARGFVNMVTPPSSVSDLIDYLAEIAQDLYNHAFTLSIWEEFQKVSAIIVGIIVCLSVGLAYILLMFIIGPIFGCCRCCCRTCGGKRVQEPSSCPGCLRVFYTVFLLCITGVLCAGMAYTNFSNDFIGYAYTASKSSVAAVISDVQSFATDTLNQMEYITNDEFGTVDCLIRRDIDDIGDEIADPLVAYLKTDAGVQDAMNAFTELTSDLNEVYVSLETINSSSSDVLSGTAQVKASLIVVKTNLSRLIVDGCSTCPDPADLDKVADYSLLPDVSDTMENALIAKNSADNLYGGFELALNNISTTIEESASSAVSEVERLLDDTKTKIDDSFTSISQPIAEINTTLAQVQNEINYYFGLIDEYWDYRYYGLIGVTCLTLLVVLFNVLGIAMGTFAYKDVLPTERSRMSNAGGNVLMAGVFFSFLFGPILMLLCFLMFAVSGSTTLLCAPLNTYEVFEKTLDQPNFIVPGYFLSDLLLRNSSIELTVSSVLTDCSDNEAIYNALSFSELFNLDIISEELYKGEQEVLDLLKKEIQIPILDLVPDGLNKSLTDAYDSIDLDGINPTYIETVLSVNVTTKDLIDFAAEVRKAKDSSPSLVGSLEAIAVELERIQKDEVEPINTEKALIMDNTNKLVVLNAILPVSISNTVTTANAAESQVNQPNTTDKVQNITADYVDKLFGYADQYVEKVDTQLDEDVAKCEPVWQSYDTAISLMCYYIFDSLNTLWFTTGWCAIFLLPSIFVAVRLAKYYRIMDKEAMPKPRKSRKGASSSRGRRGNQDMAMDDLPEDGHHTGHDNIRLVESLGQGGMQPQQNPHYIPDDVINGYDGYNNLGRPMAPPPAYHPEDHMRENKRSLIRAMLAGLPDQRSFEELPTQQSIDQDDAQLVPVSSTGATRPMMSTGLSLPPYSRHPSFEDARQGSSMDIPMAYPNWGRQRAVAYDDDQPSTSFLSPDSFDQSATSRQSSFEEAFPVIIPGPLPLSKRSPPLRQPSDPLFAPPRPAVYCTLNPSMVYPPTTPHHIMVQPSQAGGSPSPLYENTHEVQYPQPSRGIPAPPPVPRTQPPPHHAQPPTHQPYPQVPPTSLPGPLPSILISPGALRRQQRVVFRQPTVSPPPSPPLSPPPPAQPLPQPDLLTPTIVRPHPQKPLQRQSAISSSSSSPSFPPTSTTEPPVPPPQALSTISGRSSVSRKSPIPVPPPRIHIQRQASDHQDYTIGHPNMSGYSMNDPYYDDQAKHGRRSGPSRMPAVETDSYNYGYSQDPIQRQNRDSVMRDMQDYNRKPRVTTYL